jgi:RNA exonuclease NGL2
MTTTFQEVDRLEKLLPVLEDAGYAHFYAAGPGKLHGCLIAFDRNLYFKTQERIVYYDEQYVGENRSGNSIRTSNIGSLVALKSSQGNHGLIIATTHLFWHPR